MSNRDDHTMNCVELCAGAGGQALGTESAGFRHLMLIDNDNYCCATLRFNRPQWNVVQGDLNCIPGALSFDEPVDLIAGGLPCPPFSVAGKQLGANDERNLFPPTLQLVEVLQPKGVMIENVRGFLDPVFADYRSVVRKRLENAGYVVDWRLLNASDFGVPQLRPRVAIVALKKALWKHFEWPEPPDSPPKSAGETLRDLMCAGGWEGAAEWADSANAIAPTIVGGSKKHGGPDLGPTRAKKAWEVLGVCGHGIADAPPHPGFRGRPRLTVRMVARLQGFPDSWEFVGKKTAAYRQVGNAFPPPVAEAVSKKIATALAKAEPSRLAS